MTKHSEHAADVPYTMNLPDGRTLFVNVPGQFAEAHENGGVIFTPDGARFLDHVRALAMSAKTPVTGGHIRALRSALGMTLEEFGERVGVQHMTVWRWESGGMKPRPGSLAAIEGLRRRLTRRGVVLSSHQDQ